VSLAYELIIPMSSHFSVKTLDYLTDPDFYFISLDLEDHADQYQYQVYVNAWI
jgi:hypothetical protein